MLKTFQLEENLMKTRNNKKKSKDQKSEDTRPRNSPAIRRGMRPYVQNTRSRVLELMSDEFQDKQPHI